LNSSHLFSLESGPVIIAYTQDLCRIKGFIDIEWAPYNFDSIHNIGRIICYHL